MYNEQIDSLINLALTDGDLTEKEKQILFKKAESLGIDLDEFEMVLEAKLFDKKKTLQEATNKTHAAPKSDKFGDVKKCPSCGAITQSFSTKCLDCGNEFRNIEAAHNIIKFFEKLNELENKRNENLFSTEKLSSNLGCSTLIKWMFLYPILLPYKIIIFIINKSKPAKWTTVDVQKEEMIINFPIANSKEEIVEFITLSISKINQVSLLNKFSEEGKYISKWNTIWMKKCEQIYTKAKLSMNDDKETLALIESLLIDSKVIKPLK
jgi:hypothetical protein